MNQQLSEFLDQYEGEDSNTISKFRKYRSAYLEVFGLTIVLIIAVVIIHEIVGFRPAELPYSRVILYTLPTLSLFAWFIIYLGWRDIDMSKKRIIIHEIVETIKCYDNSDFDGVFDHIEILEDEVASGGNNVFSEEKQRRISKYYERLDDANSKKDPINESFEEIATILINDIDNELKLEEITNELQKDSEDEFQRNVFIDAIKRFDIGLWRSLTLLVVVASLLIYNFIGQQAGFYFAVITLTIMQIWRSGSD